MKRTLSSTHSTTPATERVVSVSDAVFAIAITFLVLPFSDLPETLTGKHDIAHHLREHAFGYLTYGFSFLIIGFQWWRHHRVFQFIVFRSETLMLVNLAVLSVVALLPYPSALAGRSPTQPLAIATFSVPMFALGVLIWALWEIALAQKLTFPRPDKVTVAYMRGGLAASPLMFGCASAIAIAGWALDGGTAFAYAAIACWVATPVTQLLFRHRWPAPDDDLRAEFEDERLEIPRKQEPADEPHPQGVRTGQRLRGTDSDRVTLLSDGVFAIGLTVLVLYFNPPPGDGELTAAAIAENIRSQHFAVYFLSFWLIGQFWIGHLSFFDRVRSSNSVLLWMNLTFLMIIAFMPFTTALLLFLPESPLPATVYSLVVLLAFVMMLAMSVYVKSSGRTKPVSPDVSNRRRARAVFQFTVFFTVFVLATLLPSAARGFPFILYGLLLIQEPLLNWFSPVSATNEPETTF